MGVVRCQSARAAGVVVTLDDSSGEIEAVSYTSDAAGSDDNSEEDLLQMDLTGRYVKVSHAVTRAGAVELELTTLSAVRRQPSSLSLPLLHPFLHAPCFIHPYR